MVNDEGEASTKYQAVPGKINQVVRYYTGIQKKNDLFLPEDKMVSEAIK